VDVLAQAFDSVWMVRVLLAVLGLPLLFVVYDRAHEAGLFEHEPAVVPVPGSGDRAA
jgi:hypothetical protein